MTAPSLLDELEPCPFCGRGKPFDQWPCKWLDGSGANVIRCAWCHGAAPANVWNRRTHHAELADMAKRLEAAERDARVTKRSAETLCRIYFEIAAEAVGEDKVRAERDRRIHATQEGEG